MKHQRTNMSLFRTTAASALAATTLAGCAGGLPLAKVFSSGKPHEAGSTQQVTEKALARAERAVSASPRNASLRADLGNSYLRYGRFESAAAAFDNAMTLGDNSGRTALGLALAKIGSGKSGEAVAILDDWRESIPASDLGLALALAGEGSRGVAVLSDALRNGDTSAKLRQNLGYAYALDGRWREARTMIEQDVAADEVDKRISDWAMQARPGDYQQRVATLLGAPMRDDPGMPTSLALDTSSSDQQLAAEATAMPEAPRVAAVGELPAVGSAAQPQPVAAPALETVAESAPQVAAAPAMPTPIDLPAQKGSFDVAFTAPSAPAAAQEGWVQPAPAAPRAASAARPAKPQRTVRVVLPAPKMVVQRTGSHLVHSVPSPARKARVAAGAFSPPAMASCATIAW